MRNITEVLFLDRYLYMRFDVYMYIYIYIKYWFDIDSQYPLIAHGFIACIHIYIHTYYIYYHYIYIHSHIYIYIYIHTHTHTHTHIHIYEIPCDLDSKESACNVRDPGSVLGLGGSPGEGNGNPLQYSYLRIQWTEEPDGLQSMGLQRVRHDWVTYTHICIF